VQHASRRRKSAIASFIQPSSISAPAASKASSACATDTCLGVTITRSAGSICRRCGSIRMPRRLPGDAARISAVLF
jgi:hypothetical protein